MWESSENGISLIYAYLPILLFWIGLQSTITNTQILILLLLLLLLLCLLCFYHSHLYFLYILFFTFSHTGATDHVQCGIFLLPLHCPPFKYGGIRGYDYRLQRRALSLCILRCHQLHFFLV